MKNNIVQNLGFWSSLYIAVLGAVYLVMISGYFATNGFTFPPGPIVQLAGGIITFLTAPGLVILFTAIRYTNNNLNQILGSLGVSFITLFAISVSINRFVQLTVIQQSEAGVAGNDLARFLPYATDSVMFALEMLGWGFFSSLAALSVAWLFSGSRLSVSIRSLFIVYAFFSSMSIVGYVTETPITAFAFIAWGPILLALSILLAFYFKNEVTC